jgi:hypothetical protein
MIVLSMGRWDTHSSALGLQTQQPLTGEPGTKECNLRVWVRVGTRYPWQTEAWRVDRQGNGAKEEEEKDCQPTAAAGKSSPA